MIARPATPGLWIDLSQRPTPAQARAIVAALDPVGVIRTLPLPNNSASQDLDASELTMWCDFGCEVMAYQHVRFGPWNPRNHSGAEDGAHAAEHAIKCDGSSASVHIWVDWEDIIIGLPPGAGKTYLEAWADRAIVAGFKTGEYCGFDDPMSPTDRYGLHGITSYWSDAGHRSVAVRGCSIMQGREMTVAGIRIDLDHLTPDLMGEVPMAWAAELVVA